MHAIGLGALQQRHMLQPRRRTLERSEGLRSIRSLVRICSSSCQPATSPGRSWSAA
jgi:hypothetical protein